MSTRDLPLDIIPSVLDELSNQPSPKPLVIQTLRACSLTCRAWRPIAQKRLLKKVSLVDPKLRSGHESKHDHGQHSFKHLLDVIRDSSHLVTYVQVLQIGGVISDPDFPEILSIFAKFGELRSFLWQMDCRLNTYCKHWYQFPKDLRTSVEAVLSSPELISIRLLDICSQFPMEIVGYSPLKYVEISACQRLLKAPKPRQESGQLERPGTPLREPADVEAQVEILRLEGSANSMLEYYNKRQDFRLNFSQLKELSVGHMPPSFTQTVLESAAKSLTHFSSSYWIDEVDGFNEGLDDYNPLDLPFRNLSNLRVITVDVHHDTYDKWIFYNHLIDTVQVLERSGRLPNCLEELNLVIEFPPSSPIVFDNESLLGRLRPNIKQTECDMELADFCLEAKSRGHFRELNLRILISDWTEIVEYFRRKGIQRRSGVATQFDEEGRVTLEVSREGGGLDIMVQPDSDCEEDLVGKSGADSSDSEIERKLRRDYYLPDDASKADILSWYLSYKSIPRRLENTFPLLKATGMLKFEVLDYDGYYSSKPGRRVWNW